EICDTTASDGTGGKLCVRFSGPALLIANRHSGKDGVKMPTEQAAAPRSLLPVMRIDMIGKPAGRVSRRMSRVTMAPGDRSLPSCNQQHQAQKHRRPAGSGRTGSSLVTAC